MGLPHHGGVHGIAHPLEVVETVLEVADVAWTAYELRRERHHQDVAAEGGGGKEEAVAAAAAAEDEESARLRSENRRLRAVLAENLTLLQGISESPSLSQDCPPDLYLRLVAAVDCSAFLTQLDSLHQASKVAPNESFPFRKAKGEDLKMVDIVVNVSDEEPSWWVWIQEETSLSNAEELSGIDNENYVIITEENVVDSIANFMARCIVANPKSKGLEPEELQKTVARALGGMNDRNKLKKMWHAAKLFYSLSTWGIALAGLYRHRAVVKVAARGVGAAGKLVLKAF